MARSWTGNLFFTPLAADIGPGPEEAAGVRAAGRGVCSLRLSPASPPTSGLARRRRWRGAQLDGEFSTPLIANFGAAGPEGTGGARTQGSWTGNLLSTPLATDFGPGPEGAGEGCSALAWSLPFYISLTGLD